MWKDVKGFEGKYQVSEHGEVKSLSRVTRGEKQVKHLPERILKPASAGRGYLTVCLRDGFDTHRVYIHRLVAEHFIPKTTPSHDFVNHIDGDKTNNRSDNLEWCSCSENNQHAYDSGLKDRGGLFYNAKLTEDDVREILASGKNGTYQEIADRYGVSKATVRDVLIGKTWKHIK